MLAIFMSAKPSAQRGAAPAGAEQRPAATAQAGLFAIAAATLMLQVSWTRVLSVSLWYHFAFLVISTAMLGFGISGVVLTLSERLAKAAPQKALPLFALGFVASTLGGFWLANALPFAPFSLLEDARQLWIAPLFLLSIATPFVFSGLVAAALLSRFSAHAGRLYFFDLLGAGLGCFAVIFSLRAGGSAAIGWAAALGAIAALCFASSTSLRLLAGAALLLSIALAGLGERLIPVRIAHTKKVGNTPMEKVLRSRANLFSAWDSSSRIDVLPARHGRSILIDAGTAMTRIPHVQRSPAAMGPIPDERQLVLRPGAGQSVLIIGSGGGWEVLAALRQGARRVVAIEINPLITALMRGPMASFSGGIFSDPRVTLHTAEARSFIQRSGETFDVIIASHTISNAAAASGALSLAENYVLTEEAFELYLARLSDKGLLFFSRPEAQIPRLMATCASAMHQLRMGDPALHLLAFAGGRKPSFYGAMIASRQALGPSEVQNALALLRKLHLRPLYAPGFRGSDATLSRLLQARQSELPALFEASPTLLAPATDDRPFFNQRYRWSAISPRHAGAVFRQSERGRMALEDQPVAEVVLLVVLVQATTLALLFLVVPLWLKRRWGLAGAARYLLYFLALGLGFILVEIALIQRLTLFVGQPVHAFAVVVGTLLVSSGIGSLLSSRVVPATSALPRRLALILLLVAGLLVLFALGSPTLVKTALSAELAARLAIAVALVAPLGLAMGMPFPLGLRHAGQHLPGLIPWAWGLNAVASVVGSVLAIIFATAVGFGGVFIVAAAVYASAAAIWLRRG